MRVHWNHFNLWTSLHNFLAPLAAVVAQYIRMWIKRRNARLAGHWPAVNGLVISIE